VPYSRADGIDDVSAATFHALASIGYNDGHVGVLIKNLLYTAVVSTGLPPGNRSLCHRRSTIAIIDV
jgi:hypothetical protein